MYGLTFTELKPKAPKPAAPGAPKKRDSSSDEDSAVRKLDKGINKAGKKIGKFFKDLFD